MKNYKLEEIITNKSIPTTQNIYAGFFGTISIYYPNIITEMYFWKPVFYILSDLTNHTKDDNIRSFLDSTYGRHFADNISEFVNQSKEFFGKEYNRYKDPILDKSVFNFLVKLTVDTYKNSLEVRNILEHGLED